MTQSLLPTVSAKKGSKIAKRAVRLFSQVPGINNALSSNLEAANKDVITKMTAFELANDDKDHRYDMVQFRDAELDNAVRDAAEACKKYDRNFLGSNVFLTVFPKNITPIIETYFLNEPAEVKKVISRVQNLGPDHPLRNLADVLSNALALSEQAIKELNDSISKAAVCQVDLEISKNNLVKTYNNTILDAIKLYGRKGANKLFPQIRSSSISDEDEEDVPDEKNVAETAV